MAALYLKPVATACYYKLDCASLAKKKGKGKRNKPRQAYVAWESESESSSDENSSESDEETHYCFMENHRQGNKKDVTSKYSKHYLFVL